MTQAAALDTNKPVVAVACGVTAAHRQRGLSQHLEGQFITGPGTGPHQGLRPFAVGFNGEALANTLAPEARNKPGAIIGVLYAQLVADGPQLEAPVAQALFKQVGTAE